MALISVPNQIVSLDLGAHTVKVIITDKNDIVTNAFAVTNPLGFSVPQESVQFERMKDFLGSFFKEHKLSKRDVRLTLPEASVVTQVISIPALTDAELASSVSWQAEQYIPIPKEELELEYQILHRPEKKDEAVENMRVLLIGVRKSTLSGLLDVFKEIGVEPDLLETETISLLRDINLPVNSPVTMVAHFGATGVNVSIVRGGELVLVVSHGDGGELMTRALMNAFNLPKEKAEGYKIIYGLQPQHFEGKIYNALLPIAKIMLSDLRNTMSFFSSIDSLSVIERLIISGGPAQTPGFLEFLMQNLNLEILPVEPFYGMNGQLPVENLMLYPVAAGLAKRKFS